MDNIVLLEDLLDVPLEYLQRVYPFGEILIPYSGSRPSKYHFLSIGFLGTNSVFRMRTLAKVNIFSDGYRYDSVCGRHDPRFIYKSYWSRFIKLLYWAKGGHNGKT